MPAQPNQRSTRPATRAGSITARRGNDGNGGTLGIAVSSLGIDSGTAR